MESYEKPVRYQRCPICRAGMDHSTDLQERGDSIDPGDPVICQHCGGFLVMGDDQLVQTVPDQTLVTWRDRLGRRLYPQNIETLLEVQRAVRARARLLVTTESD